MKKILSIALLLAMGVLPSLACTNLIVGKKASKDGSVMCTYNCDGFGFSGSLFYSPGGRHEAGEKIAIHGWGPRPRRPLCGPGGVYLQCGGTDE